MWTLINGLDMTSYVERNAISIGLGLSDQETSCTLSLFDIGSQLPIDVFQEVVMLDETGPLTNQTQNLVVDPVFAGTGASNKFTLSGAISSTLVFNGSPTVTMTLSNNAVGTGQAAQNTLFNLAKPGITYNYSLYLQALAALTNASVFLQLSFLDASQTLIANSTVSQTLSSVPGTKTRYSVRAVAPSTAVFAQIAFGVTTTSTTNSGQILFSAPQLEPILFDWAGIVYPTPDCNVNAAGCVVLPNGTSVRQNRSFAGTINKYNVTYDGSNRTFAIQCAHLSELLDLKLVNGTFVNSYDSQIIASVLSNQYANLLSGNGVTQGRQFPAISLDDLTFREMLNTFVDSSSYVYFVNNFGDITYAPPRTQQTTFIFSDSVTADYKTVFPLIDYSYEKNFTQKTSRVRMHGAKFNNPAITDPFNGDGTTKTFPLTAQPSSVHSVNLNGASVKSAFAGGTDVLGQNGILALIDKTAKTIQFQNAPTSGTNTANITYTYEANIYIQEDDVASIATYGTTFEKKLNDTNMLTVQAASSRAIQELLRYSRPRSIITAKSQQFCQPGTSVPVTSVHDGIFSQLLQIQTCKTKCLGNDHYEYEVQLGSYQPDFIDRLKFTEHALRRSLSTGNQPLQSQNLFVSEMLYFGGDSLTATQQPAQAKYGTAKYGYAGYGPITPSGSPNPNTYGTGAYGSTTWG